MNIVASVLSADNSPIPDGYFELELKGFDKGQEKPIWAAVFDSAEVRGGKFAVSIDERGAPDTALIEITIGGETSARQFVEVLSGKDEGEVKNPSRVSTAFVVEHPIAPLRLPAPRLDDDPVHLATVMTGAYPTSVATDGRYAYVTIGSTHQLEIYDLSTPATPRLIGQSPTSLSNSRVPTRVSVVEDRAYVMHWGLFGHTPEAGSISVLNVSERERPVVLRETEVGPDAWDLAVADGYAYVVPRLAIVGLKGDSLELVAQHPIMGSAITVGDGRAYVALNGAFTLDDAGQPFRQMLCLDVTNPSAAPDASLTFLVNAQSHAMACGDGVLCVIEGYTAGLQVLSQARSPYFAGDTPPRLLGRTDTYGWCWGVACTRDHVVTISDVWLEVFSLADPSHPTLSGSIDLTSYGYGPAADQPALAVSDALACITDRDQDCLWVIDLAPALA